LLARWLMLGLDLIDHEVEAEHEPAGQQPRQIQRSPAGTRHLIMSRASCQKESSGSAACIELFCTA